jgi:hypothetical protein
MVKLMIPVEKVPGGEEVMSRTPSGMRRPRPAVRSRTRSAPRGSGRETPDTGGWLVMGDRDYGQAPRLVMRTAVSRRCRRGTEGLLVGDGGFSLRGGGRAIIP